MTISKEAITTFAEKAGVSLEHAEHVLRSEQTGGRPQTNPWPLGSKVNKSQVRLAIDLLIRQGVDPAEAQATVIETGDLSIIQGQIDAERAKQQEAADDQAKQDWLTYDPDGIKYQAEQYRKAKEERAARLALADEVAEMRGIPGIEHLTEDERLALLEPPDPDTIDNLANNIKAIERSEGGEGQ